MRCQVCGRENKRSHEANRRLWKLYHILSETVKPNGQQFSPESWHEYMKGRFLGMTEIELPSGQVLVRANSSANLSVSEFSDFMTQVEVFCAENNVYLEMEHE